MKALVGGGAAVVLTGVLSVGLLSAAVFPTDNTEETFNAEPILCALPGDESTVDGLSAEQTSNAATIISTGRSLNVPEKGLVVAIAVAMQESSLVNLKHGDRDSVGLFQQRAPWGSFEDRTNPVASTTLFFTSNRGRGLTGLLHIEGWEAMPVVQAAQAVQQSGVPSAYAKWEPLAVELVGGVSCEETGGPAGPLAGRTAGEKAVNAALAYIGTPYSWGGGGVGGPSTGICGPAGCQALTTVGFDCSGLTQYAWHAAAGVDIGGTTYEQWPRVKKIPLDQMQPGDLVFFGADLYHVGIYMGGGQMVEAPRTGLNVRTSSIYRSGLRQQAGRIVLPGEKA